MTKFRKCLLKLSQNDLMKIKVYNILVSHETNIQE